jgi:hypothetical protein
MHYLIEMKTLICATSIAISFAVAAPLYSNNANIAGGGLLNSVKPLALSSAAIKDLQLALFLENLKVSYFSSSLSNIIKWGTNRYLNDTIEVVSKITTISEFSP